MNIQISHGEKSPNTIGDSNTNFLGDNNTQKNKTTIKKKFITPKVKKYTLIGFLLSVLASIVAAYLLSS